MPNNDAQPKPFTVDVPEGILNDLEHRLDNIRWPDEPDGAGWAFGANLGYMQRLAAHWRDGFDWRAAEAQINRFPQFTAPVPMPMSSGIMSSGWRKGQS